MALDDERIRQLLHFDDPAGVLSFYVGHTPAQAADPQRTAPIELRNQVKALTADLAERDRQAAAAVSARLDALRPEIDRLLDPNASGRGRALFVGVDSGETVQVTLQIPFADRAVHDETAYVRPLVAAVDEGRPAGILNVSQRHTRLLVWELGEVAELSVHRFEVEDDVFARQKAGPSPANVPHSGQGRMDRDAFLSRLDENRQRFIKEQLDAVVDEAGTRGWDRIVVAGTPKLRDETAKQLRDLTGNDVTVLVADSIFEDVAPHVIAEQVWPLLRSVHRDREATLVTTAIDRALSGNAGAVGLREVCDALNEGRVQHLLYETDLQIEGYRSDEDTLHPYADGAVVESDTVQLHPEPLFVERLIEKAAATGAKVTPVDHEAAAPLGAHDGVAALLRW